MVIANLKKILNYDKIKVLANRLFRFMLLGEEKMTSKQRAYLKSLASNLTPIFQVGKSSLTPELTEAVKESFNKNELIKIAVLKNCADDPREIAEMVAERTHSQLVQVIGKKFVLYKPDRDKPGIVLPRA